MTWDRSTIGVVLAGVSVVLTVLTGVVVNLFTDIWGWALLSALLVLASCLAIVEVTRHRMDDQAGRPAPAPVPEHPLPPGSTSVTISATNFRGMAAGRDINKTTRIGTGGLAAIVVVAVLLAGGTTALGRTDAALPHGGRATARNEDPPATPDRSPEPTAAPSSPSEAGRPGGSPTPSSTVRAESFALTTIGKDVDPRGRTRKVVDLSFDSDVGLTPLNGTRLAPVPGNGRPTPEACRGAGGYSAATVKNPIPVGFSRCVETSDGNFGSVVVTRTRADVFGGQAFGSVTIW
jgi:hypothetical protein